MVGAVSIVVMGRLDRALVPVVVETRPWEGLVKGCLDGAVVGPLPRRDHGHALCVEVV